MYLLLTILFTIKLHAYIDILRTLDDNQCVWKMHGHKKRKVLSGKWQKNLIFKT